MSICFADVASIKSSWAGFRQRFGSLPAGMDPAKTQLRSVVLAGRDRFALVLTRQGSTYKVVGLYR